MAETGSAARDLDLARSRPQFVGLGVESASIARLPRKHGVVSVACQFDRCAECDGMVHWVPTGRSGHDYSPVPEMERPRDLRPWRCDCGCHKQTDKHAGAHTCVSVCLSVGSPDAV